MFNSQAPNLNLKRLLSGQGDNVHQNLSLATDFEPGAEEHLLQRFLDTVFIYNPVLEESDLHQYIREIQFNGLGWDARSCLLVSIPLNLSIPANFENSF